MLCSRSFCLLCMMQSAETDMKKTEYMPWNVKGEIRYEEKQKDAYSIRTYDRSSFNQMCIRDSYSSGAYRFYCQKRDDRYSAVKPVDGADELPVFGPQQYKRRSKNDPYRN